MCCWPYRRYAIEDAEGRAEFHVQAECFACRDRARRQCRASVSVPVAVPLAVAVAVARTHGHDHKSGKRLLEAAPTRAQVPICCADGCRNCCAPTCFNPIFSMPITARGPSGLSAQLGALESHWPGGSQSRASHGRCGRCCGQYNRRFSSVWRRWLWCHLGPISRPDLGTVLARLQLARLVRRWDGEQQLRAHFPARRLGAAEGASSRDGAETVPRVRRECVPSSAPFRRDSDSLQARLLSALHLIDLNFFERRANQK